MPLPKIPIRDLPLPAPQGIYIFARGVTAPVLAIVDGNHIIVKIRQGGTLGIKDEELSNRFEWLPDKLRELLEKGATRL